MRISIALILLFFLPVVLFAQQKQYSSTDKEAIKFFAIASTAIDENNYDEAIQLLYKAVQKDDKFIEAHSQLADVLRLNGCIKMLSRSLGR
jgi:Tfp pilus assembly protein PilF